MNHAYFEPSNNNTIDLDPDPPESDSDNGSEDTADVRIQPPCQAQHLIQ